MHPHKIVHTFVTLSVSLSIALSFGVFVGATSFTALAANTNTNGNTSGGSTYTSNTNTATTNTNTASGSTVTTNTNTATTNTNAAATAPAQPATLPDTVAFRRGDANVDGVVDLSDSVTINEYVAGRAALACKDAADVNNDGSITTADSSALLSYLYEGGPAPVAPGPATPGLDTGADALGCGSYNVPAPRTTLGDAVNTGLNYDTVAPYPSSGTTNANSNVNAAPAAVNTNANANTNTAASQPQTTLTVNANANTSVNANTNTTRVSVNGNTNANTNQTVVTPTPRTNTLQNMVTFRRGDANGDGRVDLSDSVVISNLIQGAGAAACLDAADVNDDGAVNTIDRTTLLDWLYNGGRAPAAPGPFSAGADPTADSLGCGSSSNLGGLVASVTRFVRGDANGDGKVDQSDAIAISTHLNSGTPLRCLDAADANDDGFVTAKDAAAIESALFSAPNPAIGVLGPDETVESLGCATYTATPVASNVQPIPTSAVNANTNTAVSQMPPSPAPTRGGRSGGPGAYAAFRRGDANGDGKVDISDAITINTGISTPATLACADAADANDDGVISVEDSLALLAYLFEGGAPPAAPGPSTPGVDPTDDVYGCAVYGGVAGTVAELDTDRDGLPDFEERLRGTSISAVDTDADGFTDAEEVRNGYNPLAAASAAVSTPAQRLSFFGKSRLPNVRLEASEAANLRAAVAKILNRPVSSIRLHPTLVNARLYGGYRVEEVALVVKYGPAKAKIILPKIEASAWRTTPGYQGSAAQFLAPFTRGDVNGDGAVDISDVSLLGSYFGGKATLTCLDAADVNDDGRVDVSDLKRLTDYYSSGGTAPAAPAPGTAGADPTPDALFCGR